MILIPQGKEYRCPKCHAHISPKPPPACPECGTPLEKPGQGVDQRSTTLEMLRSIESVHRDISPVLSKACGAAAMEIERLTKERDLYKTEFNAMLAERQQIRDLFPACLDEWGLDLMDAIKAVVAECDELRKARGQ